jgi:acetyltransferase-like isoleucine patch superfamily enzyme
VKVYNPENLYLEEHTNIDAGAIIMNTNAKFIMKKFSGAAIGLTVITGNHLSPIGMWRKLVTEEIKEQLDENHNLDKDIIVGEDVWVGANVTLLAGTDIGRGAIIGAGSVVRTKVPPYAIVSGNPAKIMGFVYDPRQTIEHESKLYPESERLSVELLEKNYQKYYKKRLKSIVEYQKL